MRSIFFKINVLHNDFDKYIIVFYFSVFKKENIKKKIEMRP